jgi:lipid-A-disaccharide synthase
MPGSRESEVRRILPVLAGAADLLEQRFPDVEIVLVRAEPIPEDLLREIAGGSLPRWTVVSGGHFPLLAASDLLLVASGTATLEGLLCGVPMVVVYRLNRLSYLLGKLLVKVPHVAMANLVSDPGTGERAVPELLQGEATPARVAEEGARFLEEPLRVARTRELYAAGLADLGPPGAGERAAEAVLCALAAPAAPGTPSGRGAP